MIRINNKTFKKILFKHVKEIDDNILNAICDNLCSTSKQFIVDRVFDSHYVPIKKDSYFRIDIDSDSIKYLKDQYNLDILADIGLFDGTYIYGQVISSKNYDDDFHSHYHSFRTNLFFHDEDNKLKEYEVGLDILDIEVVNKHDITYFSIKDKYNTMSEDELAEVLYKGKY